MMLGWEWAWYDCVVFGVLGIWMARDLVRAVLIARALRRQRKEQHEVHA